jgi:MFS family permease
LTAPQAQTDPPTGEAGAISRPTRWAPGSIHYGWVIVAITFTVGLIGAAVRFSPAIFITPLEAEFGWNRAALATPIAINLLLFGLVAPIAGMLVERVGVRRLMLGGIALYTVGLVGTVVMDSLWELGLLWGVAIGLGTGTTASVLQAVVATRWFVARRGLVVGLLGTSTSTGQLVFIPALMAIVVVFGWRGGPLVLAALAAALVIPLLLWMKEEPADLGIQPYGAGGSTATGTAPPDSSAVGLAAAARAPEFWLLCGSFFVCGATSNGLIGTHLLPHSIEHGIPAVTAAATVGIMGGMNFVGTLASGWLTDKMDPRKLLAFFYAFRGLSLFILPFVTDFSGLLVFAVIFGLDWYATVPPTVTLTAQRFGRRSVAALYGWIFASHQLGAAMASLGGGWIRVWFGDYELAFLAGATLALIAAGLALRIRPREAAAPSLVPTTVAP